MSASSPRRKRTRPAEGAASTGRPGEGALPPRKASAVGAWVASVLEEKPVGYIVQNLERAYGVPVNKWQGWDVLDMLVSVILSQATSDVNSDRTYDALKKRFPTWDAVLRARESTLADTIRLGGLPHQKGPALQKLPHPIKES